jgi:hypothetical protein
MEPTTVKKPFTPHAHGTNAGASSATICKPVGNGMPRRIPSGASIAITMTIRQDGGRAKADAKIHGDKRAVSRRTARIAGIIHRSDE